MIRIHRSDKSYGQPIIMLYPVIRPLAAFAIKVFFRKIYLTNPDRIPRDVPVLLVANHPTTFTEPCILACFLDRPLYYLVRGDFFKKPLFNALLRDLHMIPVYRRKDGGFKNLKNNYESFEACHEWLAQNKTVMILAEGSAGYVKRLRPLRKGTARIALSYIKHNPESDLFIVPTAINYTDSLAFGSEVMINFDRAFSARSFLDQYLENEAKGIRAFTNFLTNRLKEHVVIIERPEDDWLTNHLLDLQRNELITPEYPVVVNDIQPLQREKKLTETLNQMPENEKRVLKKRCKTYFKFIDQLGISDYELLHHRRYRLPTLMILLGALPFTLGYVLNYLPLRATRYILDNKVIFNEFYSSLQIAAALGFFLIYYLLLLIFLPLIIGWKGFIVFAFIIILGYYSLGYWKKLQKWKIVQRLRRLSFSKKEELLRMRTEIRNLSMAISNDQ